MYWFLGNTDVPIPAKWPDSLSTHFNIETPVTLTVNSSSKADVYIAVSILYAPIYIYIYVTYFDKVMFDIQ